jgi:hypothetical protein
MIARITVLAVLVLSLAAYATTPASSSTGAQPNIRCCDGDPGNNPN